MKPYFAAGDVRLYLGDCLEVLKSVPDESVDSVVTDAPYGLAELSTATVLQAIAAWMAGDRDHVPDGRGFMNADWDKFVPPPGVFDQCMRVLKPGGYLLCFAGSRTVDLMTLSIRIAGFRVFDSIAWIYGSGWPKSKHSLKPAHEPIVVARKPLAAGSVAANVLLHGTGALAIEACRVDGAPRPLRLPNRTDGNEVYGAGLHGSLAAGEASETQGRWPPNVVFTHAADCRPAGVRQVRSHNPDNKSRDGARADVYEGGQFQSRSLKGHAVDGMETVLAWDCAPGCPVAGLDTQSGTLTSGANPTRRSSDKFRDTYGEFAGQRECVPARGADSGGASRFFPCLEWDPERDLPFLYAAKASAKERPRLEDGTAWPTVKPVSVMRWLTRLVTPPRGLVLDPMGGTAPTGEAAALEGFRCLLVEKDPVAAELATVRLTGHAEREAKRLSLPVQPDLFGEAG